MGIGGDTIKIKCMTIWSIFVSGIYFRTLMFEYSTLLRVTEAGSVYIHTPYMRAVQGLLNVFSLLLVFEGIKWREKL